MVFLPTSSTIMGSHGHPQNNPELYMWLRDHITILQLSNHLQTALLKPKAHLSHTPPSLSANPEISPLGLIYLRIFMIISHRQTHSSHASRSLLPRSKLSRTQISRAKKHNRGCSTSRGWIKTNQYQLEYEPWLRILYTTLETRSLLSPLPLRNGAWSPKSRLTHKVT